MIPKECKRLAEVDFPIAVVSKHSAREKSIPHGHPSAGKRALGTQFFDEEAGHFWGIL